MMNKGKWKVRKLGEVCIIDPQKREAKKVLKDDDLVTFLPMNELGLYDRSINAKYTKPLGEVYKGYTYFTDNDVLLAKITPSFENGKLGIAKSLMNGIGFGSSEYIVFRCPDYILPEYLFYFFHTNSFKIEGSRLMTGAVGHKRLSKDWIYNYNIPIPTLPEQQRIVSLLDEAFESIDLAKSNAEKNLENAKELFESQLNSLMDTGKSKLGHGWTEKRLKDISLTFGRGKSKHRPRNWKGLYGGEYPFIQTGDVRNANKLVTSFTQTYNETGLNQSKLWKKGTICITIAANIAETGILDFDACFPDSIIGLEVNPEIANLHFTYYVLQYFKNELQELGKGSAQANINLGTFENQLFPFPISIDEQMKIVDKLDFMYQETNKLKTIYLNKINELEELRKSILEKAFNGKL